MRRIVSRQVAFTACLTLLFSCPAAIAVGQGTAASPPSTTEIERRAFLFFWNETAPTTGLTKDRAKNIIDKDEYTVASIASTGYALAALPIGVQHGWVKKQDAYNRALISLRFLNSKLPNEHGFFYHFVDWKTGERQWKCELSSVDTGLLVIGGLVCGQYFKGSEVQRLANALYDRVDWRWMRQAGATDVSATPPTMSMGWHPESGWINARWQGYSEASFLYLLAMGAPEGKDLPGSVWTQWDVKPATLEGLDVLGGPGPIFMAQMCPGYFDLRGLADRQNYNWWQNFVNAHRAQVLFCRRHEDKFASFKGGVWGITASDQPQGYGAEAPVESEADGTIAPSAFLAGMLFVPEASERALKTLWALPERDKFWGRYGFSNALNVDKNWYDPDVIGLDLGMTLLALENRNTGLVWRLMRSHPMAKKAFLAAGMHPVTDTSYPGK